MMLSKVDAQLKFLNQFSTKLQSLMTAEQFYSEVVDLIQDQFNYYGVQIWSVGDSKTYTLQAQSGAYMAHLKIGHTLSSSQGITGYVIRTKKSYLTNDVTLDPNFTNLSLPVDTLSQICVPVISGPADAQEVVATLNIESNLRDAFQADDVIMLEAIASQLSVLITNRKLYTEARQFSSKLQEAVEEKTQELRKAHERILEQQRLLQRENKALKTLVNQESKELEIIGRSPAILNIVAMTEKIAPTTATVLIQGESGTGKELIARMLHLKSERAAKPYVTVNCGALQESLLESELFGHEKGSFTGAVGQKIGLCESAEGGTLFLDEIGELSLGIQAKLLRFLQEGEFYRIGGKRPIKVDVRVVSATNRDLELEVKEGRFREDLFYRLNTITLRMPPLRKRKEDVPMLVEFFLKSQRFGGASHYIRRVDPRAIDALQGYDWPGNIRELQNTIERMKILAENHEIRLDDVPSNIRLPQSKTDPTEFAVDLPLEDIEKQHILRTLAYYQGNKTKTAQSLGITIKTLYNKLHRYGVFKPEPDGPGPEGSRGPTGPTGEMTA